MGAMVHAARQSPPARHVWTGRQRSSWQLGRRFEFRFNHRGHYGRHGHGARHLDVHHWNDSLFSFKTTRDPGFRFESGHFVMIGLPVDGRPLMRAYSIASAHYEEHLEFFSIKVPDGQLTLSACST